MLPKDFLCSRSVFFTQAQSPSPKPRAFDTIVSANNFDWSAVMWVQFTCTCLLWKIALSCTSGLWSRDVFILMNELWYCQWSLWHLNGECTLALKTRDANQCYALLHAIRNCLLFSMNEHKTIANVRLWTAHTISRLLRERIGRSNCQRDRNSRSINRIRCLTSLHGVIGERPLSALHVGNLSKGSVKPCSLIIILKNMMQSYL